MRPAAIATVTDHDQVRDVSPADHHAPVASARFVVNSQPIAGLSSYVLAAALGQSGCRLLRAVLRGSQSVDIQGHGGAFVVGTDTAQESGSIGIEPYPSGTQSYMGGYSRLHGDGYLSRSGVFGPGIALKDAYISGSDARFVFENTSASPNNLTVYGSVVAK